jgi:hypothetical protein
MDQQHHNHQQQFLGTQQSYDGGDFQSRSPLARNPSSSFTTGKRSADHLEDEEDYSQGDNDVKDEESPAPQTTSNGSTGGGTSGNNKNSTSTSSSSTAGRKNRSAAPPLKRGSACMLCRRRKLVSRRPLFVCSLQSLRTESNHMRF